MNWTYFKFIFLYSPSFNLRYIFFTAPQLNKRFAKYNVLCFTWRFFYPVFVKRYIKMDILFKFYLESWAGFKGRKFFFLKNSGLRQYVFYRVLVYFNEDVSVESWFSECSWNVFYYILVYSKGDSLLIKLWLKKRYNELP